ncbi:hypothetical protein PC129_g17048 [Phytophthora cactorum]|uniref:RxLR effector protein n=1 Tax=Phytophthora cactorum TaxID=29920 RepID=A0A329RRI7_9STRA|nr:hypothetical protein Pcac1_g5190 [Phytophthora cactorum]KAG2796674.1 hypothetical protein PC111_g21623 [Phytophthora cactorum]KAG2797359.1 hypothetical protein PC112_g21815 [Phytophthora cactorum]KAG2825475.1 hypothetical protein PC113_g21903 [Phytophthora cactorum]KAG2876018.1 hypothetical protein PC114_g24406 [Phytophthora cactorum]
MRFVFFLVVVVATFTVSFLNFACAKEQVKIKVFDEMWKNALVKMKENGDKFRGWTSTWNSSFDTRKASGQLKNVDEKQAAKLTENVAEEVVKNSTKWRFVKKALVITFGVGIAALIVVGIDAMAS